MKKLLIATWMLFLTACTPVTDDPIIDIDCETYPTHKDCSNRDEVDEGIVVDESDTIGNYDNLGFGSDESYDGRELVPTQCQHLDNIGAWQPVWCDEFEYTGLPNPELWNYDIGGGGWGNNELQYYRFENEDNAYVDDGVLRIRTLSETFGGRDVTSARLITAHTGDWLYGKIQVRAIVPAGLGTWPAIWMLPTDWKYGGWPVSGEIDIMEYVGYQPGVIHGTIHTGKYNHMNGTQQGFSINVPTAEEQFHVYELEWEVGVIRLYVDGQQYAEFDYDPVRNTEVDSHQAWPFDQRFHLLINTAFGGNWGGAMGTDDSILPVDFIIDYVRVYQKNYSGMDESAPSAITNLEALAQTSSSLFVSWDAAMDDVMVKQYLIYVNDDLVATTSVNGYLLNGLTAETTYDIRVVAEDFAGNRSPAVSAGFDTLAPQSIDERVEAEDYAAMSGIQTEPTSDLGGGENVGWIDDDDYLEYQLEVTTAGTYRMDVRLASMTNGADFDVYLDDQLLASVNAVATGGWQTWQTVSSSTFQLEPGIYTFRLIARTSGFNINYFDFIKVD